MTASLRLVASRGGIIQVLCNIFGDPRLSFNQTYECNGPYYYLPGWWTFGNLTGDALSVQLSADTDGFLYVLNATGLPLMQRLESPSGQIFPLGTAESLAEAFSSLMDMHASPDPCGRTVQHIVQSIELYTAETRLATTASGVARPGSASGPSANVFHFSFTDESFEPLAIIARNLLAYDCDTVIDRDCLRRVFMDGREGVRHGVEHVRITDFVLGGTAPDFTLSVSATLSGYSGEIITTEKALSFAESCSGGADAQAVKALASAAKLIETIESAGAEQLRCCICLTGPEEDAFYENEPENQMVAFGCSSKACGKLCRACVIKHYSKSDMCPLCKRKVKMQVLVLSQKRKRGDGAL